MKMRTLLNLVIVTSAVGTMMLASFYICQSWKIPKYQHVWKNAEILQTLTSADTDSQPQCQRKTHLSYVKTQKTGSSTITNMLYRQSLKFNLTVLLMNGHSSSHYYPLHLYPPFKDNSNDNMEFDIFSAHIPHNNPLIYSLMPEDTVFLSSIRNPVTQLKSHLYYVNKKNFLKVEDISKELTEAATSVLHKNRYFNIPKTFKKGKLLPMIYLNILHDKFPFVIVYEYYDESLLLLKRELCWDIQDILYMPLKVARHNYSTNIDAELTKIIKRDYMEDYLLYEFYNKTLWQKISKEHNFQEELQRYRTIKQQVLKYGTDIKNKMLQVIEHEENFHFFLTNQPTLYIQASVWNQAFTLTAIDIVLMMVDGLTYRGIFMEKQLKGLCEKTYMLSNKISLRSTQIVDPDNFKFPEIYCDKNTRISDYNIPLKVLSNRDAYDLFY